MENIVYISILQNSEVWEGERQRFLCEWSIHGLSLPHPDLVKLQWHVWFPLSVSALTTAESVPGENQGLVYLPSIPGRSPQGPYVHHT